MYRTTFSRRTDFSSTDARSGLSRIEVVVLGVVGLVLTGIAVPLILQAREYSRRNQCQRHFVQLTMALHSYNDAHGQLPPAAVWRTDRVESLALHQSRRWEEFIGPNWFILVQPHLMTGSFTAPILVSENDFADVRVKTPSVMACPSDDFQHAGNLFELIPLTEGDPRTFSRGNVAINGGTHCFHTDEGSTATPTGDHATLVMESDTRSFELTGNGIAGFNRTFRLADFENGLATLVAMEEVRAGVHPADPRGVWALGHIASSVTWAHGVNGDDYGPNNSWARSDDIRGCAQLHAEVGTQELTRLGMPCVSYLDDNQNATARSRHTGGINLSFLDGAVRFVGNDIDPGLWHVLHSRETPEDVVHGTNRDALLSWTGSSNEAVAPARSTTRLESRLTNSIGMDFVEIPAGEYIMGVPDFGNDHDPPSETPPHQVKLSNAFLLGVFEVTQGQYEEVMGTNPSQNRQQVNPDWTAELPVENLSWHDATSFCSRLGDLPEERLAGRQYRLPTEAEWEYACRAGSEEPFDWHSARVTSKSSGYAIGSQPALTIRAVGSYPANPLGLHDMRGNVWEWCSDWFDRDYYSRARTVDPAGPADGYFRVVRGGDWIYVGEGCYINYPILQPWISSPVVGFRVVCVPN